MLRISMLVELRWLESKGSVIEVTLWQIRL